MSRKPPIRTYQRKNVPNPLIKICDSIEMDLISKHDDIPKEQHKINNFNENKISEDSLDYDPFETTFDRIAKDAVVPPIPLDCIDDKSWYDSSFDTSNEKKEQNKSLFDISIGIPNNSISSDTKYNKSWGKMPYGINIKEKNKKIKNIKIVSKSERTRKLRTLKKENDIKDHKKKKKVRKATGKKENKSNNTGPLCSTFNTHSDKLYEVHTVNADINEKTNNENITNTNVISTRDICEENNDLLNSNKSQLHNPFKETTNILNIHDKKEKCLLKSINKIQELDNKSDLNYSSISSESFKVPYLTNSFKMKSCSVMLSKDNIEKWKLMINKSNNIAKYGNIVSDKMSDSTLNYKLSMNDMYLKENLVCSTPINTSKKKSACSLLYSPINTDSSMKYIADNTNENILHIKTNVSVDHVQLTDFQVLDQMSINNSTNAELCTKNNVLYEENVIAQKSTSMDHLSNSKNKADAQEQQILHLETSENSSNFINNRERYDTIFMDDSIGIAFKQKCSKTHHENNLPNFLNTFGETNRSHSLFNDSESKLHAWTNDMSDTMSDKKHKSLTNVNMHNSNVNSKLELEFSALEIYNDEEIIKLEIPKQEESCELVTTTKEESIKKYIENENENNIEGNSCSELCENQNQSDMNETNVFFTRLQDSVQVTKRKKQNWKKNFYLSDIHENENEFAQYSVPEMSQHNEKVNNQSLSQNFTKNIDITSVNTTTNCDEPNSWFNKHTSSLPEKFIFLKPGKFWTRSLSILHNFQNGLNLNEISVEKGKKWRHSVKAVLEMQKKDLSSSCREADKHTDKLQLCNESQIKFCNELTKICNTNKSALSKQFTRRISVRVVRDSTCIQNNDDISFLEVYGISPNIKSESTILETSCTTKCNIQPNSIENNYPQVCSSKIAREVVLQRCSQKNYLPFSECVPNTYLKYCRKIGEGVYGEVFLYEKDTHKSVLKIIPIEGDQLINGEPQKKFNEILSEIVIAKELHNLRFNEIHNTSGFVKVKSIKCIKGKYPEEMINLWKMYDNEKTSDNDCPSIFDENQLYIALELDHGGQDLESFEFHTAFEAHTLFIQTALALAVAEKSFKFEHRDLHWGNILISYTDEQYIHYKLNNKDIFFPSNGVKVCIIDFTLSRMSYQGCCIFNDLALDPALFTAQGEYQFEIYRLMRNKIQNNWQEYEPYTNILWLHYILDKMVTIVRYKKKNLKKHKNAIAKLQNLKQVILSYQSAFDFVNNCDQITNLVQSFSITD